ncbi:MAG: DegT/DnrJ/EryC1/StrS family aminotransferase [Candidatus Latescibacterota bacterium]|nr:DegT/DnrJ/EryC1/StrS family aminotransferase [Candidatus Latescibacterota bacterium]
MTTVYDRLGVPMVINAVGPSTRLSGGVMRPEVAEAMVQASQYCVDIASLQARASEIISEFTGSEAGYVTSGAAAALLLGTAACVTGMDPSKMNRLPDTRGMKNEVVMARSHRNFYDHAVRSVGIKLVEIGIADRFSGAGVRDAECWEYGVAITERTAAVVYVAYPHTQPKLEDVCTVAHDHGIPVLVDAAGQLPPESNLRRFISEGADLVSFSGGKAIGGPQSSGFLCGRRDLIAAAALQHLDLDILPELWDPPSGLIDRSQLPGAPQHGIGRPCKVGKEEIVGLLTALRFFVEEDVIKRDQHWLELMNELVRACGELSYTQIDVVSDKKRSSIPIVRLELDEAEAGITAIELVRSLQDGSPSIAANPSSVDEGIVIFGPTCLKKGEPTIIGNRLKELLKN